MLKPLIYNDVLILRYFRSSDFSYNLCKFIIHLQDFVCQEYGEVTTSDSNFFVQIHKGTSNNYEIEVMFFLDNECFIIWKQYI